MPGRVIATAFTSVNFSASSFFIFCVTTSKLKERELSSSIFSIYVAEARISP